MARDGGQLTILGTAFNFTCSACCLRSIFTACSGSLSHFSWQPDALLPTVNHVAMCRWLCVCGCMCVCVCMYLPTRWATGGACWGFSSRLSATRVFDGRITTAGWKTPGIQSVVTAFLCDPPAFPFLDETFPFFFVSLRKLHSTSHHSASYLSPQLMGTLFFSSPHTHYRFRKRFRPEKGRSRERNFLSQPISGLRRRRTRKTQSRHKDLFWATRAPVAGCARGIDGAVLAGAGDRQQ